MPIVVYGREGCRFCVSAKEKLELLSCPYTYVDIEAPGDEWRDNGAAAALAWYQLHGKLPIIVIDKAFLTYPEAMKLLKGRA